MRTCRHRVKPISALRGAAVCLVGVGLVGAAAVISADPATALAAPAPAPPPRGPAAGVSIACDNILVPPGSPVSCTITGLTPSEPASVVVEGSGTQVPAPPADATGTSIVTLQLPAADTGTRTVQVTEPQSGRTSSTDVAVSNQTNQGTDATSQDVSGGGGALGSASSATKQNTSISTHALVAILVAVLGIIALASRKQLRRMKA